jgi:hypothetical protein
MFKEHGNRTDQRKGILWVGAERVETPTAPPEPT